MILWTVPVSAATAPLDHPWQNLPWPIELNRWPHQFGPNFGQFQDLGSRYFHGGQDILSFPGAEVRTPVGGVLGGGYYSYRDLPTGHSEKSLVTLREHLEDGTEAPWGKRFFEVSVTTDEGYRLEFHHVDPENLPEEIRQGIFNGTRVSAGAVVGFVIDFDHEEFGVSYDHIHYNVYSPDNHPINPMQISAAIEDTRPPQISLIGYGGKDRCRSHLGEFFDLYGPSTQFIPSDSGYLVVQVSDHLDNNSISQGPTMFEVEFVGHSKVTYDFRNSLFDEIGEPYNIRQMFQEDMCAGVPDVALPIAGSSFSQSYLKVAIPREFSGTAVIRAGDFAGNSSFKKILIQKTNKGDNQND